jgi:hypothetical protein
VAPADDKLAAPSNATGAAFELLRTSVDDAAARVLYAT